MRGYSGGMKRRLDLALALVHRPEMLFLDEPTTGLDVQSRTALWSEVSRLAREDGVTVFLTTQYLEEADVLADRVGIIDHGHIVAEGTPAALKAEVGRPTVEAVPAERPTRSAPQRSSPASASSCASANGVAVRLDDGQVDLTAIVRALDADRAPVRRTSSSTSPRSTTSSSRRPAARSRARATRRKDARSRAWRWRRPERVRGPGRPARPPLGRPHDPAAGERDRAARLPAAAARGQLGRAQGRDAPARLPDELVRRLRARRAVHPGRAVRDDEHRHRPRARHPDRVPEPALADADARDRAARRPARRRRRALRGPGGRLPRASGSSSACGSPSGPAGVLVLFAFAALVGLGFGALGAFAALRTGSGEAVQGLFPAFFVFLFISSMNIPRNLIEVTWFRDAATLNPVSYLLEVRPQPDHRRLGRRGARARVRDRRRDRGRRARCRELALRARMAR